MEITLKEDDVVLCTVKKIEGTSVFVEVEGNGEGSIMMSEIAAGRIRNLRDYVTIGKKIVCKVMRITNGHPELSLRRVTAKERDLVISDYKKEVVFLSMLKKAIRTPEKVLSKIREKHKLSEFFDLVREDIKILEKFLSKTESEILSKIIAERSEKEKSAKKVIEIRSFSSEGVKDIKSALDIKDVKDIKINYLGSSRFSISAGAKDFKAANAKLSKALEQIEKTAKKKKMILNITDK